MLDLKKNVMLPYLGYSLCEERNSGSRKKDEEHERQHLHLTLTCAWMLIVLRYV